MWAQMLQILCLHFIMSRMVNMNIFYALTKIKSLISSYKQNTKDEILCFVKQSSSLVIVYIYMYVVLVHTSFIQSFLSFVAITQCYL